MDKLPQGNTELVLHAISSGCVQDAAPAESSVSFDVLREEGNSLVRSGQFSEALECYSRCIALCPENAVGYTNRALCYLKLSQVGCFVDSNYMCTDVLQMSSVTIVSYSQAWPRRTAALLYHWTLQTLRHSTEEDWHGRS